MPTSATRYQLDYVTLIRKCGEAWNDTPGRVAQTKSRRDCPTCGAPWEKRCSYCQAVNEGVFHQKCRPAVVEECTLGSKCEWNEMNLSSQKD